MPLAVAMLLLFLCLRVPGTVTFTEDPQIARWDGSAKQWRTDGFDDFNYDPDKQEASFKTVHLSSYALMQVSDTFTMQDFVMSALPLAVPYLQSKGTQKSKEIPSWWGQNSLESFFLLK